jgi:hypothetical protein
VVCGQARTHRGQLLAALVVGLGLSGVQLWARTQEVNLWSTPGWLELAYFGAVVLSSWGFLLASISLIRYRTHPGLALGSLCINALAIALALGVGAA